MEMTDLFFHQKSKEQRCDKYFFIFQLMLVGAVVGHKQLVY